MHSSKASLRYFNNTHQQYFGAQHILVDNDMLTQLVEMVQGKSMSVYTYIHV